MDPRKLLNESIIEDRYAIRLQCLNYAVSPRTEHSCAHTLHSCAHTQSSHSCNHAPGALHESPRNTRPEQWHGGVPTDPGGLPLCCQN